MRQPVATLSLIALGFAAIAVGISPGASAQEPAVEEQIVDAFPDPFRQASGPARQPRQGHRRGRKLQGLAGRGGADPRGPFPVLNRDRSGDRPLLERDRSSQPSRRRPERQSPRHGGKVPPAGRQRNRHGDQQPALLPGGHSGRVPRPAAGRGIQQAGQPRSRRRWKNSSPSTRRSHRPAPPSGRRQVSPPSAISASTPSASPTRREKPISSAMSPNRWPASPISILPTPPSGRRITSATI